MRLFSPVLALLFLGQISLVQGQTQEPRSIKIVSSDERVVVHGQNNAACSTVLSLVTALRKELNNAIKEVGDASSETIFPLHNNLIITLYGQAGDPAPERNYLLQPRRVESSERFRIDFNIHLGKGLDRVQFREKALECLLLDHSLNSSIRDGQPIRVAPWLITGVLEKMAWRKNEADRGLYKALFKNGLMMNIEELLELEDPSELDAADRTSFKVSAGAFILAMLNQEDGSKTFLSYLEGAPSYEGEPLLFFRNTFFEAGLSKQGLAKWWALQLANLTQDFVTETLSPLATENALSQILQGDLQNDTGEILTYRLIAFQDILALPEKERRILLAPILERIRLLSFRCFPSYRPLLAGYARITEQLAEGDDEGIAELLNVLEKKRMDLKQVGLRTRDYLDWYQIVAATKLTGEFETYQRLKQELETQNPSHPSSIDHYLNAVQKLYDE